MATLEGVGLSQVTIARRGHRFDLHHGRFRLDIKDFFTERIKHWNCLSREAVESLSLWVLKQIHLALSAMV